MTIGFYFETETIFSLPSDVLRLLRFRLLYYLALLMFGFTLGVQSVRLSWAGWVYQVSLVWTGLSHNRITFV